MVKPRGALPLAAERGSCPCFDSSVSGWAILYALDWTLAARRGESEPNVAASLSSTSLLRQARIHQGARMQVMNPKRRIEDSGILLVLLCV